MTAVENLSTGAEPISSLARVPSIRVSGVSKSYNMYNRPFDFMRELLTGRVYHRKKQVLRDVTFDMHEKEIVGIIGRNGAGKSTLLKIIAGTLSPTTGTTEVRGRVSAILELGTGFNPAFSGRENVILSALMRGMSEAEVRAKLDSIIAFSGLQDVIDEPFQTYSSGMQGRLAFAAAVSVDADVIIIDEALSTGDARFAARSLRRIHEICKSGVTALFVSHNSYQVMQLCTRAIWIKDGAIAMDGSPLEVVRAYEYEIHDSIAHDQGRVPDRAAAGDQAFEQSSVRTLTFEKSQNSNLAAERSSEPATDVEVRQAVEESSGESAVIDDDDGAAESVESKTTVPRAAEQNQPKELGHHNRPKDDLAPVESLAKVRHFTTNEYRILGISFLDRDGTEALRFKFGESLKLRVIYECLTPALPEFSCGLAVAFNRTSDFEAAMSFNTCYPHSDEELSNYFEMPFRQFRGRRGIIEAVVDPIQLRAGEYFVSLGILPNQPGMHEFYEYLHCHFRVTILPNGFDEPSVFYPMVSWINQAANEDGLATK